MLKGSLTKFTGTLNLKYWTAEFKRGLPSFFGKGRPEKVHDFAESVGISI